ncbi:MAG: hypothetical protein IT370_25620 [Deltaproteobacteria bacterium]|nr:hypothetical protein [Deltaproteobacteria bacterium]
MRLLVVAGLGLLMGLGQAAKAEPVGLGVAAPVRPLFTFEGQVGLGSPLGVVGAAASLAVTPWVDVGVGGGMSIDGLQAAGTVRLHPDKPGWRGYVGVTVSQGSYVDYDGLPGRDELVHQGARWVSVEGGAEQGARGLFTRWGLGLTKLVDSRSCRFVNRAGDPGEFDDRFTCQAREGHVANVYLAFTLGYRY